MKNLYTLTELHWLKTKADSKEVNIINVFYNKQIAPRNRVKDH